MPNDNLTPEDQGFGHYLVISTERVSNEIDPDATADTCGLLNSMTYDLISFWKMDGPSKLFEQDQSNLDI